MPRSKSPTAETKPDAKPARPQSAVGKVGVHARCSICQHEDRHRIELAMARGVSRRTVAKQYGVSDDAAYNHYREHVGEATKASLLATYLKPSATIEAILNEELPGLLERLARYRAGLAHLFDGAVEMGDRHGIGPVARELREIETLIASQTGELRARAQAPIVHLHAAADFVRLRQGIATALRPYPEALAAVSSALRDMDAATPAVIEGTVIA